MTSIVLGLPGVLLYGLLVGTRIGPGKLLAGEVADDDLLKLVEALAVQEATEAAGLVAEQ